MAMSFTAAEIQRHAPDCKGVYFLFESGVLVYIGRAAGDTVTIRSRLYSHVRGDEGPCTKRATAFDFEATEYPYTREKELLESYQAHYGRLPRCNSRVG